MAHSLGANGPKSGGFVRQPRVIAVVGALRGRRARGSSRAGRPKGTSVAVPFGASQPLAVDAVEADRRPAQRQQAIPRVPGPGECRPHPECPRRGCAHAQLPDPPDARCSARRRFLAGNMRRRSPALLHGSRSSAPRPPSQSSRGSFRSGARGRQGGVASHGLPVSQGPRLQNPEKRSRNRARQPGMRKTGNHEDSPRGRRCRSVPSRHLKRVEECLQLEPVELLVVARSYNNPQLVTDLLST